MRIQMCSYFRKESSVFASYLLLSLKVTFRCLLPYSQYDKSSFILNGPSLNQAGALYRTENTTDNVEFQIFMVVTMKNGVFWDVAPCGSCKNRRFGGT
jgi:hypothetical protein